MPKRKENDLIRNPAYDEEEFNSLSKELQTHLQKRSMRYLQGPNGSLREEPPPGWTAGRARQKGHVSVTICRLLLLLM